MLHSLLVDRRVTNKMQRILMSRVLVSLCSLLIFEMGIFVDSGEPDLRKLFQDYPQNQELVRSLGTKYDIVYPKQFRPDSVSGLSTRSSSESNVHIPRTFVQIKTLQFLLKLDLELNIDLLAPTLVQSFNLADSKQLFNEEIENCYYHATIRNHSNSVAAFHTCNGISGIIYFEDKVFSIHPLHGDRISNHPHLMYYHFNEDEKIPVCDSGEGDEQFHCMHERLRRKNFRVDEPSGNKYIELGLILDQAYFEMHNSPPKVIIAKAIQTINCVDLHYRLLNTSISIVYIELWTQDQVTFESDINRSLGNMQQYIIQKINRIEMDAVQLFSGLSINGSSMGGAVADSICTIKAIGISKVHNIHEQHVFVHTVVHMLGHNLGMFHDHKCCNCSFSTGCHMSSSFQSVYSSHFSSCSISDYYRVLRKGLGVCLFNMPRMRESICGNGIVEKEEECDCGLSEECQTSDSCCDHITCKFIKNAECSSGPCCEKCKLLNSNSLCRPSRGECDIPEYCDGKSGQCPLDLYKKTGTVCGNDNGYCYQGTCPLIKQQCEAYWGVGADVANTICFKRLNVQGTPNGNCGVDNKGNIFKCSLEDAPCGSLQCRLGQKDPTSIIKPITYVINKIKHGGEIHECKATPRSFFDRSDRLLDGIVKEGSRCDYRKICLNWSCVSIDSITSGTCPTDSRFHLACAGHGVCTNINTCHCDEQWTGEDCSRVRVTEPTLTAEEMSSNLQDPIQFINRSAPIEKAGKKLMGNLSITIIVAATFIGIALMTSVILVLFYSKNMLVVNRKNIRNYK